MALNPRNTKTNIPDNWFSLNEMFATQDGNELRFKPHLWASRGDPIPYSQDGKRYLHVWLYGTKICTLEPDAVTLYTGNYLTMTTRRWLQYFLRDWPFKIKFTGGLQTIGELENNKWFYKPFVDGTRISFDGSIFRIEEPKCK